MAVTISRTLGTDDDGSGTTGTVINSAWKTEFYNQIDAALAELLPLAGGTMTGALTISYASNAAASLRLTSTAIGNGLTVGGDVNFYRSAAAVGAMDGKLSLGVSNNDASALQLTSTTIGNGLTIGGDIQIYRAAALKLGIKAHTVPDADNTYNLGVAGTTRWKDIFAVTKTSSLDVSWTPSKTVLVSVLEGPEYRLYDSGTVRLDANGQATVALDPKFVEVVNLGQPYQVLTGGARVTVKTAAGFALRGQANDDIDYLVIAVRAGFENVRWRDPSSEAKEPLGLHDPWDARNRKDARNNTATEPARRATEDLPPFDQTPDGRAITALRALTPSQRADLAAILGVPLGTATKAQIRDAIRALTPKQCAAANAASGLTLPCRTEGP